MSKTLLPWEKNCANLPTLFINGKSKMMKSMWKKAAMAVVLATVAAGQNGQAMWGNNVPQYSQEEIANMPGFRCKMALEYQDGSMSLPVEAERVYAPGTVFPENLDSLINNSNEILNKTCKNLEESLKINTKNIEIYFEKTLGKLISAVVQKEQQQNFSNFNLQTENGVWEVEARMIPQNNNYKTRWVVQMGVNNLSQYASEVIFGFSYQRP